MGGYRGLSVFVSYLMYITFAITVLSIVLFSANKYLDMLKTEFEVKRMIEIYSDVLDNINRVMSCYNCSFSIKYNLPSSSLIKVYNSNGNGIIEFIYIGEYNVSYKLKDNPYYSDLNVEKIGNIYKYSMKIIGNFNVPSKFESRNTLCLVLVKALNGEVSIKKC